jgi:hypothetical protein
MAQTIKIKPDDVTKIAWALHDRWNLHDDHVKDISNALWGLLYPNKERWKKTPRRPKN